MEASPVAVYIIIIPPYAVTGCCTFLPQNNRRLTCRSLWPLSVVLTVMVLQAPSCALLPLYACHHMALAGDGQPPRLNLCLQTANGIQTCANPACCWSSELCKQNYGIARMYNPDEFFLLQLALVTCLLQPCHLPVRVDQYCLARLPPGRLKPGTLNAGPAANQEGPLVSEPLVISLLLLAAWGGL